MGRLDISAIDERFRAPIAAGVVAACSVGAPGFILPPLDVGGVAVTWTTMLTALAVRSGYSFSADVIAKLVVAAVSAVASYKIGCKILTLAATPLILACPVAGVPAALALNVGLNGLFTLRLGLACTSLFSRPGCTPQDALDFVKTIKGHMVRLPSMDELRLVRELLTSRSSKTEPATAAQTKVA